MSAQFPAQREGAPELAGSERGARPGPSEGTEHQSGVGTPCRGKEGAGSQRGVGKGDCLLRGVASGRPGT